MRCHAVNDSLASPAGRRAFLRRPGGRTDGGAACVPKLLGDLTGSFVGGRCRVTWWRKAIPAGIHVAVSPLDGPA
jgi:hypothetical protein